MKFRKELMIVLFGTCLLTAHAATAEVNLRFTPEDTVLTAGSTGRLAIFVDDLDANVRTIDIHVTYDTTVVTSIDGGAGALYTASGFTVFQGIENDVPGKWHGYAVILGSTDFLTGPGELYYWDFSALADGVSPIIAVEAYVAAGDGTYYPDVVLRETTIIVGDPLSAADDIPHHKAQLNVWPNPFNPRASLLVDLPEASYARVAVYDLRGHNLIVLHDGELNRGAATFVWDGRDSAGKPQPTGQYLFRLQTKSGQLVTRATLIK